MSGYHPQANGQMERTNQTLEQYLHLYCNYQQTNWLELLPVVEFAFNNATNESTGVSPFFANKGYHPNISISLEKDVASIWARELAVDLQELHQELKNQLAIAQKWYSMSADHLHLDPPNFSIGSQVFIKSENIRTTRPVLATPHCLC